MSTMPKQGDWTEFYKLTSQQPAWDTLLTALQNFDDEGLGDNPQVAADLGSGAGRDTFELLKRGWRVLAVDAQAEAGHWIQSQIDEEHKSLLQTMAKPFEKMVLPPLTLINASYSLPFCGSAHFDTVWQQINSRVHPGGRFSGHLFGDHDSWASTPLDGMPTHHLSRSAAEALFTDFEIELFDERNEAGTTAGGGEKHWHVYSVVAKKKATN